MLNKMNQILMESETFYPKHSNCLPFFKWNKLDKHWIVYLAVFSEENKRFAGVFLEKEQMATLIVKVHQFWFIRMRNNQICRFPLSCEFPCASNSVHSRQLATCDCEPAAMSPAHSPQKAASPGDTGTGFHTQLAALLELRRFAFTHFICSFFFTNGIIR